MLNSDSDSFSLSRYARGGLEWGLIRSALVACREVIQRSSHPSPPPEYREREKIQAPSFASLWVILAALCLSIVAPSSAHAALRAGAAVVDISPTEFPVLINGNFLSAQATQVTDPIYARCVVLDDGATRVAICVVDACVLGRDLLDEAKAEASKTTGIPADHMLISATHAHSCPSSLGILGTSTDPHYPALLKRKLIEVIEQASKQLVPAKVAWGIGNGADYVGCRRWIRRPDRMLRDPFGDITVRANMHPGYLSTDVIGPSGPIDPAVTVLSIRTADDKPLALLANFGMHYFSGVRPVSSDYYAPFCQKVAKLLSAEAAQEGRPGFVAMMSQGCSGDMWRVDYGRPKKNISLDQYADALAQIAVSAVAKAEHHGDISLAMVEKEIKVEARLVDEQKRLEWARKIVADMGDRIPTNQQEAYAREAVYLHDRPEAQMKLQAIRIGDFGIVAMPNEVYALTGLKIKTQSPLAATMCIELANDELGYIPPPEQHTLGGYTTWPARSSYTATDTEPKMVETVLGLLEQASGKSRRPIAVPAGPYALEVLKSHPSAFWRMAEMNGPNALDFSGNGVSAAYEDGVVFYLEGPQSPAFCGAGTVHRAAHFCGGRMVAHVTSPPTAKLGYSIEMWFWNGLANEARPLTGYLFGRMAVHFPSPGTPRTPGEGKRGSSVGERPAVSPHPNPPPEYREKENASGDVVGIGGTEPQAGIDAKGRLFFSGGGSKPTLVGRTVIQPRTWNHLVLVRQPGSVIAYLNGGGEPEFSGEADALATERMANVYIGGRADKDSTFEGKMDEVALFDRPLERPEAAAHFRSAGIEAAPATQPVRSQSSIHPMPPTPPAESVARMKIRDGYIAELMASEPLIQSPVAMAFGPDGKLWVIEMTEYPLGKHGTMDPSGRVVYLESTHNDGKYDKATIFAENLNFPNGILPWRKGVIVTAAPDVLYLEDTTGSGKADKKEVLYTGFTQGNPQLRINTPTYGLDNWVYLANGLSSRDVARSIKTGATVPTSGHDIKIRPDEGAIEVETGVSQYGRKMDNWGSWFGVHNSFPVRSFIIPDRYANRNKDIQLPRGYDDAGLPPNPKVYPASKGQKRYGYAFFEQSGHFTSACQLTPYRDDLLFPLHPDDATDQLFVCEPAHNLVQHIVLKPAGSSYFAERAAGEEFSEFLASQDDWCRPCFLTTGPDGALWMVDIYRFFIDHPDFLPPEGKNDMRPFYRLGDEMGRIYRIYPKNKQPRAIPRLDKLDTAGLVAALDSSSGWQRDMAQMMLVWHKDPASVAPLEQLVQNSSNPLARMHALCTLDGLGQLKPGLIERALTDSNAAVRRQAVRLSESYAKNAPELIGAAVKLADDPDAMVRLQLAFTLGEWDTPAAGTALAKIAVSAGDDVYLAGAVMSSATLHYAAVADGLIAAKKASPLTRDLLAMALARNNRDLAARLLAPVLEPDDGISSYAKAQFEAFAYFLDDLAQHRTNPTKLAGSKDDALAHRLAHSTALFAAAREAAAAASRPGDDRSAAISLLGREESKLDSDVKLLAGLLNSNSASSVRKSAVRALARIDREDVPEILLGGWKTDPQDVQAGVLDALLSREPWAYELLLRVQKYQVAGIAIDPSRRQRLIHYKSSRVRVLADKLIGESSDLNRNRVVEKYHLVNEMTGDAVRGQKVFATNCVTCHHLGNIGNEIGPNLQSVAHWTPDALMVAILDPSRSAEPRYLGYNCVLDTGETFYGLLVQESAAGVVIKGIDAIDRTIPRRQIKSLECTNRSLMPDGLEAAIDKQQMADLVSFLQSQGGK